MIVDSFTLWALGHTLLVILFVMSRCSQRPTSFDKMVSHRSRRPYRVSP